MRFVDRQEAGRKLAELLRPYAAESPIVLALPRGGVPVGAVIAEALGAPLDVWVVRKLGAPYHEELGLGAVAEGGIVWFNEELIASTGTTRAQLDAIVRKKSQEISERVKRFRGGKEPVDVEGRTVLLVDDGIATGGTVHAALQALRKANPARIVLAVPVAAAQSLEPLAELADEVVCIVAPTDLLSVGSWYESFAQVEDDEVVRLLDAFHRKHPGQDAAPQATAQEVAIAVKAGMLHGTLTVPPGARGLVVFAHGSGSSRFSPRNRFVAGVLQRYGLATLLFDLLTDEEGRLDEESAELRFDIPLLARRLSEVTDWIKQQRGITSLPIGYFGSSTGAAAALIAAADRPGEVRAVVSRGGRVDLAGRSLAMVRAPTLMLVGSLDEQVLELNEDAARKLLNAPHRLVEVPGATHLFEEPGTLEQVANLAAGFFQQQLSRAVQVEAGGEQPGA